jgi:hypothetical protein
MQKEQGQNRGRLSAIKITNTPDLRRAMEILVCNIYEQSIQNAPR